MNNINWNELKRSDEYIDFYIEELEFKYKPITQGQLFDNYDYFMVGEMGNKKTDIVKQFKVKLDNLKFDIPKQVIKEWLKLSEEKTFEQLNREEKFNVLDKINKKDLISQLINKLVQLDSDDEVKKK